MRGYPGGMKAVLSALLIFAAPLCAGEYQKDFADLKAKVPKEKMDAHLADWRTREPENPDAWILSSNWTLEQADGVEMRGKNGKKLPEGDYKMEMQGERIIIVGKDGKPVGEMVSAMNPDGVRKAAGFLGEALKKWPHRADIHCGLATIFARATDFGKSTSRRCGHSQNRRTSRRGNCAGATTGRSMRPRRNLSRGNSTVSP